MSSKVIYILVVLLVLIFSLAILANSMTKPIGRDEHMYCTAGVLLAQGKMIYRDFSYVAQMPCHPLLLAALYKISNTTSYLLAGRLLSSVCDIITMLCIIGIYRYIFKPFETLGMFFGLAGAVLYIFNPSVDYANGYAWNNDVVILCVVICFWLFISTDFEQKSKFRRIAFIGALLTLATCMRITTALVQILFFIALMARGRESIKQRFKTILPFLIASAIVLIWPVWLVFQAPRAFLLDVFVIQILNSEWLHKIGLVHNKFALTYSTLTTPGYLAVIVIAVYLCTIAVWQRHKLAKPDKVNTLFAALLPLAFFAIALSLPTLWRQHLAVPVPFLIIAVAYPLLYLRKLVGKSRGGSRTAPTRYFNIAAVLVALSALVTVISYPAVLYRIPKLFNTQQWTAVNLHRISEDIAYHGQDGRGITGWKPVIPKDPKLILTLAPLYALEGGCNIYTELSAGSFVYRVADYMPPADRAITRSVGPQTLGELLEKTPPSAVVLGVEMDFLEEEVFQTAVEPERQKWEKKEYENGLIVYFRR